MQKPAPGPTAQPGPGEKPVPLPPPVPKPDKTAPSLKAITLARSFTFARTLPGVVTPKRAQLRLTLSEAATLSLTFERRSGKGYKKVAGVVTLKAKAGAAGVRFTGALSAKKRLTPGVYRLTIVATDAAGNRSKPKQFTFRLKR